MYCSFIIKLGPTKTISMAVEDFDSIDDIQMPDADTCMLVIEDGLDWEEAYLHASTIQNKLKTYIYYIESGQLLKTYPEVEEKSIVICIRGLVQAPDKFYDEMNEQIAMLLKTKNIGFEWEFAVD